jgi:hypothetical protein
VKARRHVVRTTAHRGVVERSPQGDDEGAYSELPVRDGVCRQPSCFNRQAQKNWSAMKGAAIDGTPAHNAAAVVPAPQSRR